MIYFNLYTWVLGGFYGVNSHQLTILFLTLLGQLVKIKTDRILVRLLYDVLQVLSQEKRSKRQTDRPTATIFMQSLFLQVFPFFANKLRLEMNGGF